MCVKQHEIVHTKSHVNESTRSNSHVNGNAWKFSHKFTCVSKSHETTTPMHMCKKYTRFFTCVHMISHCSNFTRPIHMWPTLKKSCVFSVRVTPFAPLRSASGVSSVQQSVCMELVSRETNNSRLITISASRTNSGSPLNLIRATATGAQVVFGDERRN